MVLCLIVECSTRTRRDKVISFFRVLSVITNQGEQQEELTAERRMRWISAISRDKMSDKILENDSVCSRHFVSGRPAALWDKYNTDWVPTLHLGHTKSKVVDHETRVSRAERSKARAKRANEIQEQEATEKRKRMNEPGEPISSVYYGVPGVEDDEPPTKCEGVEHESTAAFAEKGTQTEDYTAAFAEKGTETEEFTYLFKRSHSVLPFEE